MKRKTLSKPRTTSRRSQLQKQSVVKSAAKHPLRALHQSIGNQAVQRLIQSHYIQAKLNVSQPGDQFEQEADRTADAVTRMSSQQTGVVQRAFNGDDNHNLQSDRFSGNDRLENIFDGKQEEFLRSGSNGDAVALVQETLIELGFPLPTFGADGKFGNETGSAVSKFKDQNGISPSDPVVWPKTIGALDAELVK